MLQVETSSARGGHSKSFTFSRPRTAPRKEVPGFLARTCEERPAGIQRASSLGDRAPPHEEGGSNRPPLSPQATTPRSPLLGARLIGPAASSMTSALVPKAQRVCDSSRFIRLDYTIGSQLGAGRFASVRRGVERASGEAVAIKILHRTDPSFNVESVRTEIAAMRVVEEVEQCCSLLAVYEDWESIYLVQQLAAGGSLAARAKTIGRFCEADAAVIVGQVLQALAALHKEGIAHRDVKFENILMVSNDPASNEYNHARLCDFGLCKALDSNVPTKICGTKLFWAPEIVQAASGSKPGNLLPEAKYDSKVDIWGVGVILYTLLWGKEPFRNQKEDAMYAEINRGAAIPVDSTVSPGARDLASLLLTVDPIGRPTAAAALQHEWLVEQCSRPSSGAQHGLLLHEAPHAAVTDSLHTELKFTPRQTAWPASIEQLPIAA